jgi:putative DNA methylase
MIAKECKRLAEVDFPIAVVSRSSVEENKVRHGHPKNLHLWWARRPLASCRAILLALLLPDPCDPSCPDEFKKRARNILPRVQGGGSGKDELELRKELLRFVGNFSLWDKSANPTYMEAARGLVQAAWDDDAPLVVDTFAGGGSIPLEALRLGCESYASDLNPVAALIDKVLLDIVPRTGDKIVKELREFAFKVRSNALRDLARYYPIAADGTPINYLWAHTIICDNCGAEIPLMKSFWLSKKAKRRIALRYIPIKLRSGGLDFDIFQPKKDSEVQGATVKRGKAVCLECNLAMSGERVQAILTQQLGGNDPIFDENGSRTGGARLLAVATVISGSGGRRYRLGSDADYKPVLAAILARKSLISAKNEDGLTVIPDERIHSEDTRNFWVAQYGVQTFGQLFTSRQAISLAYLSKEVRAIEDGRLRSLAALLLGRCADFWSSLSRWKAGAECPVQALARPVFPFVWDFAEANPWSESTGSLSSQVDRIEDALLPICALSLPPGQAEQADACRHPLNAAGGGVANILFTDPPYYDAIPYADLSDYFYVWHKRTIDATAKNQHQPNDLTPKDSEAVQNLRSLTSDGHPKDREFYEQRMSEAFSEGRKILKDDGVGCVVFAHKTTEGWEALLSGLISGRWIITASWPIATEMTSRLRAKDSASLGTSVHLICRPRPDSAPVGDWADILRELPERVGTWIEKLQSEGIRGADLVFACIGPAMQIYSQYRRVEDAEGREIPLGGDPAAPESYKRGFLAYVWETVGRLALEEVLGTAEARARNGAAGALEEDSRLTALFLWTLQTTETDSTAAEASDAEDETEEAEEAEDEEKPQKKKVGHTLIYDVARRFAQPLGIHLDKWEGRIIETEKGIVRLLPVVDRASQLFGEADAAAISRRIEADIQESRNYSFAFMQDVGAAPRIKTRGRGRKGATHAAATISEAPLPQPVTTLDRLHAAMLLQRGGQTNGLRAMLREETQRSPDFLRLANALSRLYPKDSEEKRLLDAMLLAVPRN